MYSIRLLKTIYIRPFMDRGGRQTIIKILTEKNNNIAFSPGIGFIMLT